MSTAAASKVKQPSVQLRTINLSNKVKVIVPQSVIKQIKYLCSMISAVEWSGILFYDIEGDMNDAKNLVVTLKHILPMHKGTGGSTEYDFDEQYVKFKMDHPEGLEWLTGHIHSHNNMGAYFSGTDMSEIHDNSEFHNFYLSVVVNNRLEIVGKIGFRGEMDGSSSYTCKTSTSETYEVSLDTIGKALFVRDCEIEIPTEEKDVDDKFATRVSEIVKKAERRVPAIGYNQGRYGKQGSVYDKPASGNGGTKSKKGVGRWREVTDDLSPYEQVYDRYSGQGSLADRLEEEASQDLMARDPEDAGDVEDFIEFLFGLGISPTGNYDYMDAIEELGEEIRNETGDFALENIMTNFSALYLRFFDSECTQEEMEHVLEAIIVMIKSYTGLYVTEVDKVIVPTFLAFQKEFVKKSKTRKGAKA